MASEDGPDDGSPEFRTPPPPDDRLWRHPSELPRPRARTRTMWPVAAVSAMVGALLATGVVAATGGLPDIGSSSSRKHATVVAGATTVSSTPASVNELVARLSPSLVRLEALHKDGIEEGTGLVVRDDGSVLTNEHFVHGAEALSAQLPDGRRVGARSVAADTATDLAVVKLDGVHIPTARMGTAGDLRPEELAILVRAAPKEPAVAVRLVRRLHLLVDLGDGHVLHDAIAADGPVTPDWSGGALVDGGGAVVGVLTSLRPRDGRLDGMTLAVPVDVARSVADQLLGSGKVTWPWLGVEGTDIDGDGATRLNVVGGVNVDRVITGSPAEHSGVREHDVITTVDGRPLKSMGALVAALAGHKPGDTVTLDLVRGTQHSNVKVTLAERPPDK